MVCETFILAAGSGWSKMMIIWCLLWLNRTSTALWQHWIKHWSQTKRTSPTFIPPFGFFFFLLMHWCSNDLHSKQSLRKLTFMENHWNVVQWRCTCVCVSLSHTHSLSQTRLIRCCWRHLLNTVCVQAVVASETHSRQTAWPCDPTRSWIRTLPVNLH